MLHNMKKIFLAASMAVCFLAGKAQFATDYLKAADSYFIKGDYYSASQYYEKYFTGGKTNTPGTSTFNPYTLQGGAKSKAKGGSSREEALFNLAESYRLLNYHLKAEPVYRQLVEEGSGQYPLARFHYATMLRALEKFAEAEQQFQTFLSQYTTADSYTEMAKREVLNLQYIQQQLAKKDLGLYNVQKLAADINSTGATYAPVLVANTLFFTSTRPDSSAGKNALHNNRVYQASFAGGTASGISRAGLAENKETHQGVVALSPNGNTLFLTRWSASEGKKSAALYSASKNGSGWSEPVLLDASINAPGSNTQQPFITPDGKYLLFSSDRPGGLGGFDLWMAELDASGKAANPVNLGGTINTKWDEEAPYYHAPSGTLVFSTNGRVGMGGLDFFYAVGTPGKWSEPVNFGYPVNSVKDDVYFISTGSAKNILENVLMSSDRAAACCLELFSVQKKRPLKEVSGLVVACETNTPLSGATLTIVDAANKPVFSKTIDGSGAYTFTLEDYTPLKAVATLEGYRSATLDFNAPADAEALSLSNPAICLAKIPEVGETEVLNNVYYEFNKAYLLEESFASLDKLLSMLTENPAITIEIGGHTDSKGTNAYNQKLSEARAQSVVDYLVSKGIDKSRLFAKGYGETMPVAPNTKEDGTDNPEGREMNRRTEFKILSK